MWTKFSPTHYRAEIDGLTIDIRKGSFLKSIPGRRIQYHDDLFYPVIVREGEMITLPHARTIAQARKIVAETDFQQFNALSARKVYGRIDLS